MKITTEFSTDIDTNLFIAVGEKILQEKKRVNKKDKCFLIPLNFLLETNNITDDIVEEIIRILEWKNLISRRFDPLKPDYLNISVYRPESLQSYLTEIKRPELDPEKCLLKYRGEEAEFGKNSKQWILTKLLYEKANRIVSYEDIASELNLEWDREWKNTSNKKKINNYVSEIRQKLKLPKDDQSLFFCNGGYMMLR